MTDAARLDRLEASHVRLMTDHEVFVHEQEKAWERNQQSWDRHDAWLRTYEVQCDQDRADAKALDGRIAKHAAAWARS